MPEIDSRAEDGNNHLPLLILPVPRHLGQIPLSRLFLPLPLQTGHVPFLALFLLPFFLVPPFLFPNGITSLTMKYIDLII